MDGWDGRLSPSASLLRAPYGANKQRVKIALFCLRWCNLGTKKTQNQNMCIFPTLAAWRTAISSQSSCCNLRGQSVYQPLLLLRPTQQQQGHKESKPVEIQLKKSIFCHNHFKGVLNKVDELRFGDNIYQYFLPFS